MFSAEFETPHSYHTAGFSSALLRHQHATSKATFNVARQDEDRDSADCAESQTDESAQPRLPMILPPPDVGEGKDRAPYANELLRLSFEGRHHPMELSAEPNQPKRSIRFTPNRLSRLTQLVSRLLNSLK